MERVSHVSRDSHPNPHQEWSSILVGLGASLLDYLYSRR
jgi:hypothetical protein